MRNPLHNINAVFGVIMILVVTGLAIGVMTTDMLSDRLYGNKRVFFVVMLLGYAVYRGFRLRSQLRARTDD